MSSTHRPLKHVVDAISEQFSRRLLFIHIKIKNILYNIHFIFRKIEYRITFLILVILFKKIFTEIPIMRYEDKVGFSLECRLRLVEHSLDFCSNRFY